MREDIYYFNPAEDSEWPIHEGDDKCETCDHFYKDCNESYPVKLAFNLDGYRGHYLAADFISEAVVLLRERQTLMTLGRAECLFEAEECADTYRRHNELSSADGCTDTGICECEHIHDEADYVESVLTDYGYIIMWNDGVYVYERLERPTTDPTD